MHVWHQFAIILCVLLQCSHGYKILAVIPCYRGHSTSMIGVVRELEKRGNDVTVHFTARCAHLMYDSFNGSMTFKDEERPDAEFVLGDPYSGLVELTKMWMFEINSTYHQTLEILDSGESFDVVYGDFFVEGALIAGEGRRVPVAVNTVIGYNMVTRTVAHDEYYHLRPRLPGPDFLVDAVIYLPGLVVVPLVTRLRESLRARHGLAPLGMLDLQQYYLRFPGIILGGPPIFVENPEGNYPQYIGYISDVPTVPLSTPVRVWLDQSGSKDADQSGSRHVVLISFGTMTSMDDETAIELLREMTRRESGFRFFWTFKYPQQMERLRAAVPELDEARVMLSPLLPHSEWVSLRRDGGRVLAFVTHCGLNSALEAIDDLVPTVGIAGWADQFIVGQRAEDLGCGLRLDRETFTVHRFFQSLHQISRDYRSFRENILQMRSEMRRLGGYAEGARVVERIARDRTLARDPIADIDTDVSRRVRRNGKLALGMILGVLLLMLYGALRCLRRWCGSRGMARVKND